MASLPARPSTRSEDSASANWAFEVAEQEKQLGVFFDTIIVCTVTGSTHAGMIAGFAALQEDTHVRPRRVLGIEASATLDKTRTRLPESPDTQGSSSSSAGSFATTRSPSSRAGPTTSTASPSSRRSTRSG